MRHMRLKHADEKDVEQLVRCTDKAKKERLMMKLYNLGNHVHNKSALKLGVGQLIVAHRPTDHVEPRLCSLSLLIWLLCQMFKMKA